MSATNIQDLPTDPAGGSSEPVTVPNQNPVSLDQVTISQIVSGLQQASLAGATTLPSRDIPMRTDQITNDAQVQPNYVPEPSHRDYIMEDHNPYIEYERKTETVLDNLYDELQAPLLLAILYFLFQLPFFKSVMCKYLPFTCNSDGNYNINGLLVSCALFGSVYYSSTQLVKYFSRF